jgi:hypothetical protein
MQPFLRRLALVLVIAVTFLYPLLAPTAHRIDERHFKMIRQGMTEAEVEAIFGAPAGVHDWVMVGDDTTRPVWVQEANSTMLLPVPTRHDSTRVWVSRHGIFGVSMDRDRRVYILHRASGAPVMEAPWKRWWRAIRW